MLLHLSRIAATQTFVTLRIVLNGLLMRLLPTPAPEITTRGGHKAFSRNFRIRAHSECGFNIVFDIKEK
jgi:hypothetical protein